MKKHTKIVICPMSWDGNDGITLKLISEPYKSMEKGKPMDAQIKQIVDLYKELEQDGWTKAEMVKFGLECLEILIPEAEQFVDMAGPDKKKFVVDALEKAYFEVNPDIPWVPEPFESMVEKFTVHRVIEDIVSPAIDWFVAYMKKRGIL